MKLTLASMLVLAFALAPAYAADSAPAANPPADSSGDTATPAAAAPVPDPFVAEIFKVCSLATSGDPTTVQKMKDDGWDPVVEGDTQTAFYQAFDGEKDFEGVGTVDVTFSTEVWPSLTEGYCTASIDSAGRKIGVADLNKMPQLKGDLRTSDDGITGTWEENVSEPSYFVQADQHASDLYFVLDVSRLIKKPAADIPHVAPPAAASGDDTSADPASTKTNT